MKNDVFVNNRYGMSLKILIKTKYDEFVNNRIYYYATYAV